MKMHYDIKWLKNEVTANENLEFLYFWGHTGKLNEPVGKFCFSQWYESPFVVDGVIYKTAEHWMMARKALLFGDLEIFEEILVAEKPAQVKELGRKISGFNEEIWVAERYEIVKTGNFNKFSQHPELSEYLLGTGDKVLAEASPVDSIWGIGLAQDHADASNPDNWLGLNLLGFALMEVRDSLV